LNKSSFVVRQLRVFVLLIILVSCTTKKEKEPVFTEGSFLEMDGNGGKFYTGEDMEKAIDYLKWTPDNSSTQSIITLQIPLSFDERELPLVKVNLNGQDYLLGFDTGSPSLILPIHILRGMRMLPPFEEKDFAFFSKDVIIAKNYAITYLSGQYLQTNKYISVISYLSYASRCDYLTIDFKGRQLTMHNKLSNTFQPSVEPISFELSKSMKIIVPATIDGQPMNAMLDSGWCGYSEILTLDESFSAIDEHNYQKTTFCGDYSSKYKVTEISSIIIGQTVLNGGKMNLVEKKHYVEFPEFYNPLKDEGIDVCLGGRDFFSKCRFTIDYKNKLCWIEPYE